ncbi:MAG: hypothetical protein V4551_06080, partial [Pseudomonadota bacterium]
ITLDSQDESLTGFVQQSPLTHMFKKFLPRDFGSMLLRTAEPNQTGAENLKWLRMRSFGLVQEL